MSIGRTAHHEPGHAVAAFALRRGVVAVTIEIGEGTIGHTDLGVNAGLFDAFDRLRPVLRRELVIMLAGVEGERLADGGFDPGGDHGDVLRARELAEHAYGEGADEELDRALARARAIVSERRGAVVRLARELLSRRSLSGREARAVTSPVPLRVTRESALRAIHPR